MLRNCRIRSELDLDWTPIVNIGPVQFTRGDQPFGLGWSLSGSSILSGPVVQYGKLLLLLHSVRELDPPMKRGVQFLVGEGGR
jgi:hypothetical protein